MKLSVSVRVTVEGHVVEGVAKREDFPSSSEVAEDVTSLDEVLAYYRRKWGVNADIELYVWRDNLSQ